MEEVFQHPITIYSIKKDSDWDERTENNKILNEMTPK